MAAAHKQESKPIKKPGRIIRKVALIVLIVLVLLAAAILVFVPVFVSSARARQMILAKANNSIDGTLDFASVSMGWFRGIKVSDISFKDTAGRTKVAVKDFATKPHYLSLLTGSPSFGKTVIDQPSIEIDLQKPTGGQQEKETAQKQTIGKQNKTVALPVKRIDLVVNDGNLLVKSGKEQAELSDINTKLALRPPGEQSSFDMSVTVKDSGGRSKLSAAGKVKPAAKTGWTLAGTSGDVTIEVKDLDLASLGPILDLAGAKVQAEGIVNANINGVLKNGELEKLDGAVNAKNLQVKAEQLKGDTVRTDTLDAELRLNRQGDLMNVEKLSVRADFFRAEANGVAPTTFGSLAEFVRPDSKYELKGSFECDVPAVMSQLSHTLAVKEQMKVTSGKLTGSVDTLTENGRKKLYAQANLAGLAGIVDGKPVALSQPVTVEAKVSPETQGVKFDKLAVSSAFAAVDCTGDSKQLNYKADVDLSKLQAELGQFVDFGRYNVAGELAGNGQVSAQGEQVAVTGSAGAKNFLLSADGNSVSEPSADMSFAFDVDRKDNILSIKSFAAKASFGQVSVRDAVVPLNENAAKPMKLVASAGGIDLTKLQPYAVMFGAMKKQMQLSGTAQGEVSVTSRRQIYSISTDSVKLSNLVLISPGKAPFVQKQVTFTFDGDFDTAQQSWAIRKMELKSPNIKMQIGLSKDTQDDRQRVQGKAMLDYDWSAIGALIGAFMPEGLKLEGKRADTISFSSKYKAGQPNGFLANLNTQAGLGFDRAEYMGLNVGATNVSLQMNEGLLEIAPFNTTVNNGQLNFAGQADFRSKPAFFRIDRPRRIVKDIDINDKTSQKLLRYVNPLFANAIGVSGVANFNCEKLTIPLGAGSRDDIEVVGTISIEKVSLQPAGLLGQLINAMKMQTQGRQLLTIHPTRFVLSKGVLRYEDMQIDIGSNPVNFKGSIGLDERLDMTVILPYTIAGKTAKLGSRTEGSRISVPLTGTIRKPQLNLEKFLQDQVIQTGLDLLLRRALEK